MTGSQLGLVPHLREPRNFVARVHGRHGARKTAETTYWPFVVPRLSAQRNQNHYYYVTRACCAAVPFLLTRKSQMARHCAHLSDIRRRRSFPIIFRAKIIAFRIRNPPNDSLAKEGIQSGTSIRNCSLKILQMFFFFFITLSAKKEIYECNSIQRDECFRSSLRKTMKTSSRCHQHSYIDHPRVS